MHTRISISSRLAACVWTILVNVGCVQRRLGRAPQGLDGDGDGVGVRVGVGEGEGVGVGVGVGVPQGQAGSPHMQGQ